jgi:hypothetical protein
VVVYPLLPHPWARGKPPEELRDAYLRRLGDAVQAFNAVRGPHVQQWKGFR